MTLSPGGTAVLSGTLRNTCGKPWPEGAGGEPLRVGARLFRQSAEGEAVREFRASWSGCRKPRRTRSPSAWCSIQESWSAATTTLSIDVVKEQQFWLAEKGATPTVIPVVIA